jgi:hypothetical protein
VWHGVSEYLLFVAMAATAFHALSRRYLACTLGGAALCSVGNLVHEAWLADWQINIGWGPPMFMVGLFLAMPVCAVAGLPWLALRLWRAA